MFSTRLGDSGDKISIIRLTSLFLPDPHSSHSAPVHAGEDDFFTISFVVAASLINIGFREREEKGATDELFCP